MTILLKFRKNLILKICLTLDKPLNQRKNASVYSYSFLRKHNSEQNVYKYNHSLLKHIVENFSRVSGVVH